MDDINCLNIVYSHRTMGRGAEGMHILNIVNEFKRMGHCVTVISPPGIDPLIEAGQPPVDMSKVNAKGMLSFWKNVSVKTPQFIFELFEIAYNLYAVCCLLYHHNKRPFDFVYERHGMFFIAGTWFSRLTGVPLILEVNEVCGPLRARKQTFQKLAVKIERSVYSNSSSIFTVSSFLAKKVIERGGHKDNVLVVPNAINPVDFSGHFEGSIIRHKYSIPDDTIVFGFAGWFSEWDNLELLVLAFFHVKSEIPTRSVHLMLVGDGPVLRKVNDLIVSLGIQLDVTVTGAVPRTNVLDYMDAIDVAVIAGSNEYGSPMAMFEFMALGKPVIAPNILPMTDVISDGCNGIIYTDNDQDDLVSQMTYLAFVRKVRDSIGETAKARVLENNTWHMIAKKIIKRYQGACTAIIGVIHSPD